VNLEGDCRGYLEASAIPAARTDAAGPGHGRIAALDGTRYARYFEEAHNGVPIRMALLALLLGLVE
jgi:hypothetical protein